MEVTRAQEHHVPPPVDIYETREGLILIADLPGVSKENLEVHVDDDTLTIQAKAQHKVPGEPIYREYELSNFFRQFEVGDQIDTEKIKAELQVWRPEARSADSSERQAQAGRGQSELNRRGPESGAPVAREHAQRGK